MCPTDVRPRPSVSHSAAAGVARPPPQSHSVPLSEEISCADCRDKGKADAAASTTSAGRTEASRAPAPTSLLSPNKELSEMRFLGRPERLRQSVEITHWRIWKETSCCKMFFPPSASINKPLARNWSRKPRGFLWHKDFSKFEDFPFAKVYQVIEGAIYYFH